MSTPEDLVGPGSTNPQSQGTTPGQGQGSPTPTATTPSPKKKSSLLDKAANNIGSQLQDNLGKAGGEKKPDEGKDRKPEDMMKLVDNLQKAVGDFNENLTAGLGKITGLTALKQKASDTMDEKLGEAKDAIGEKLGQAKDAISAGLSQVASAFKSALSPGSDTIQKPTDSGEEIEMSEMSSTPSPSKNTAPAPEPDDDDENISSNTL